MKQDSASEHSEELIPNKGIGKAIKQINRTNTLGEEGLRFCEESPSQGRSSFDPDQLLNFDSSVSNDFEDEIQSEGGNVSFNQSDNGGNVSFNQSEGDLSFQQSESGNLSFIQSDNGHSESGNISFNQSESEYDEEKQWFPAIKDIISRRTNSFPHGALSPLEVNQFVEFNTNLLANQLSSSGHLHSSASSSLPEPSPASSEPPSSSSFFNNLSNTISHLRSIAPGTPSLLLLPFFFFLFS